MVVLGGLLPEWGGVVEYGYDTVGMSPFAGWEGVVQQTVVSPGMVPLVAVGVWAVVFCGWLWLMSMGKVRREVGWDVGLFGLWGVLTAVWAQVLTVANGGFEGGRFGYYDLGLGFWVFLGAVVVSFVIRFIVEFFDSVLEEIGA